MNCALLWPTTTIAYFFSKKCFLIFSRVLRRQRKVFSLIPKKQKIIKATWEWFLFIDRVLFLFFPFLSFQRTLFFIFHRKNAKLGCSHLACCWNGKNCCKDGRREVLCWMQKGGQPPPVKSLFTAVFSLIFRSFLLPLAFQMCGSRFSTPAFRRCQL